MSESAASLTEYAKAKQGRNPMAEIAKHFLMGAASGFDAGKKAEQQQFENALKLIDAEDKVQSIKQKKMEMQYTTDLYKKIGIIPYDQRDDGIARETAGTMVGDGKRPVTTNTTAGRVTGLFNDKNFGDYDMEVTIGPKPTIKLSTKKPKDARTPGQEDERHKNDIALAERMASRDHLERLAGQMDANGQPLFVPGVTNPANFPVPPELVDTWLPYAQDLNAGNLAGAKSKREAMRAKIDPLAGGSKPKKGFSMSNVFKSMFGRSK